jgi:hypothetical protein
VPPAYAVEVTFRAPLLPATVGFSVIALGVGWRLALHDARSGKPHLTGTIEPVRHE